MITFDSICEKLGFDPLTHQYCTSKIVTEDDSIPSPFAGLTPEEIHFLYEYMWDYYKKKSGKIID